MQMVITDWEDLQTLKWAQTVDPHQSEECELLLETYSMQVQPHPFSKNMLSHISPPPFIHSPHPFSPQTHALQTRLPFWHPSPPPPPPPASIWQLAHTFCQYQGLGFS